MFGFITIPSSSVMLAQVGEFSGGMFDNLIPVALAIVGIIVGGLLVSFLINAVIAAVSGLAYMSDRRENKYWEDEAGRMRSRGLL